VGKIWGKGRSWAGSERERDLWMVRVVSWESKNMWQEHEQAKCTAVTMRWTEQHKISVVQLDKTTKPVDDSRLTTGWAGWCSDEPWSCQVTAGRHRWVPQTYCVRKEGLTVGVCVALDLHRPRFKSSSANRSQLQVSRNGDEILRMQYCRRTLLLELQVSINLIIN